MSIKILIFRFVIPLNSAKAIPFKAISDTVNENQEFSNGYYKIN